MGKQKKAQQLKVSQRKAYCRLLVAPNAGREMAHNSKKKKILDKIRDKEDAENL